MNVGKQFPWTLNEISVMTCEISILFLKNCENCLFLLIFVSKRRLNIQDNVPDPCLKRMHDNNDDSEHDPEYDCDSKAEPEYHSDSCEELGSCWI